jgi:hypothetical protein
MKEESVDGGCLRRLKNTQPDPPDDENPFLSAHQKMQDAKAQSDSGTVLQKKKGC